MQNLKIDKEIKIELQTKRTDLDQPSDLARLKVRPLNTLASIILALKNSFSRKQRSSLSNSGAEVISVRIRSGRPNAWKFGEIHFKRII